MDYLSNKNESAGFQNSSNKSSGNNQQKNTAATSNNIQLPALTLPKGGGAIKGINEKFQVNAVTGTSSFSIPLPFSPSRQGFVPSIGLNYNSGSGNSPFGLGWQLSNPSIVRKTTKKLPEYKDEEESDIFILAGAEDLVPLLEKQGDGTWKKYEQTKTESGIAYVVKRYRPRIEGLFARIEQWKNDATGEVHWRTINKNNSHAYYGLTTESRLTDPNDESKIFEWLLCRTHDDKGNIFINYFKQEDFAGVEKKLNEKNRINCSQTYLKKVVYGNKQPYYLGDAIPAETDFMFKVIFDYGEHDTSENIPKEIDIEKNNWACRKDPFSNYRSGFEVRTYRRCNRVLIFHCFDENELPHTPYLTRSLQLFYDDNLITESDNDKISGFSFLVKAKQNGHIWNADENAYSTKYLPEIEMNYQQHAWNTDVQKVTPENLINLPAGLADKSYLWVDLFNEGIAGILTEKANAWYYKSNLGNGNFSPAKPVLQKPSFNGLANGKLFIYDLEGNGIKYLVNYEREPKGFFKFTDDDEWEPMKNFESLPNINSFDANLKPIDLNGDGIADWLFTDDDKLIWYAGAGEKGFEVSQTVIKEIDEEKGPAIVFADRKQSIFLADMSGDGLMDIVRIRNSEISYWPNKGYGKFGSKVNMDNAPLFDFAEAFNPSNLRLADVDGSGTTDIIYLGKNKFSVWMNLNGNEWTVDPKIIDPFPHIDNLSDVVVLDFLGSGTSCIVYSSLINTQPLQYIDLMGSKKPGLFSGYKNNCGKETTIEYKSSAFFYLEDKKQGNKWITKLPFPVHCIYKTISQDKIRESILTCSYKYRHGYFDHEEQEYRGFARVEQLDTDDYAQFKLNDAKNVVEEDLHQPPVKTISWYHTGAFVRNKKILHQCEDEYFKNVAFNEYALPEPLIADDLSDDELIEAYRACKGLALRTEIYALDNSDKSALPYSASQSAVEVRLLQPKNENRNASFLVVPSESISYAYERIPADPRIAQTFILETDELGNTLKTCSITYPRVVRPVDNAAIPDKVWNEQNKLHILYGESFYTNDVLEDDVYRLRATYESKAYEINGIAQPGDFFFNKKNIATGIVACNEILFEEEFDSTKQKRLSTHGRDYFYKDDLTGALPLGKLSALSILYKSCQLAFTKNLITKYYGTKVTDQMLVDAKYVHSENDEQWWTQTGETIFPVNARDKFYTPAGSRDVFDNESFVEYDQYTFLTFKNTDAIGNFSTAQNDYRTLLPVLITDANLNRAAIEIDELGLIIKSAVMGKEGDDDGDTLNDPTTKMEYDLFNWQNNSKPNHVHMFAREQHGSANTRWQESYVYSDGDGNIIMTKTQAEPGKAKQWNETTKQVEEVDANPRWIGNGRTIFNNKNNPVKKYEPYFSITFEYESEDALVETGVTSVQYYDAVGRSIKTEFPNGSFSKIEFDAWQFKSYDVNDTVKESKWYIERGSPDPLANEPADVETRAAWLAAKHYNTPAVFYSDSIGRPFVTVADFGNNKKTFVYSETDALGRYAKSFDQFSRQISYGVNNLVGASVYCNTAEKGEKWLLQDSIGRLFIIWNSESKQFRFTYDALHRPVGSFIKQAAVETLYAYQVYGDVLPDAAAQNMKGRTFQTYDQSGVATIKKVDFKGNATAVEIKLAKEYNTTINWSLLTGLNSISDIQNAAAPQLETEAFTSSFIPDALNRPVSATMPDQSVLKPIYNEGNLLDSLQVQINGAGDFITFLSNQDYDAKGQRQFVQYGNGTITRYFYDSQTFRLINLVTNLTATTADAIQNIFYTHDPKGNITQIKDNAQQTNFFKNAVVFPENRYEYDSLYQLIKATGREHAGLTGNTQRSNADLSFFQQLPLENDATAVRNYTEQYEYDDCGNTKTLQHIAANANWKTRYKYEYEDDSTNNTNRLKATSLPGDADGIFSATYIHDTQGRITSMPHLSAPDSMQWNFMSQLQSVDLGGGGKAYYVYSSSGKRVRKIIERNGGKKTERIYLGAVEIYRERTGNKDADLERYTLHVSDDTGTIAQVDTKTIDKNNSDTSNNLNQNNIRYQYGNHLGSAVLETDDSGNVISYEEYHPFGTSSYRISKPGNNLSLKRYRFSGKEHDDETGFYYFGARYYAAWLGRWTSTDPAGFVDGMNLFEYCRNNPVILKDANGTDSNYNKELDQDFYIRENGYKKHNPDFQATDKFVTLGNSEYAQYKNAKWGLVWVKFAEDVPSTEEIAKQADGDGPIMMGTIVGGAHPLTDAEFQQLKSKANGTGRGSSTEKVKDGGKGSASGSKNGKAGGSANGKDSGSGSGRSFMSRGGWALLSGLLLLGAGLLTIFTLGAATPLLVTMAGTMATAGGVAVTTTSAILITSSYAGATTAEQDRQVTSTLQTVSSLSSPLGLVGGTTGVAIAKDPMQGLNTGAFIGNLTELGIGVGRFGMSRLAPGTARELSSDTGLIADMAQLESTVPRGAAVVGSHGSPGMFELANGAMAPVSELTPLIQSAPQGQVMLLMCNVAQDPAAVQALSNATGRSITAFTDVVGSVNYSKVWAFTGNVATHVAPPSVFNPGYLSPYLSLTPNIAAPGAAAVSGAQNQ